VDYTYTPYVLNRQSVSDNGAATGYASASRVTSVVTNNGETTVAFGYDDANRQISEDQTLAGYSTRRVETPRDADGNRTSLNVQNAYSINYSYTQRNQLASIGNFANFSYDTAGNMTRRQGIWCYPNDANFAYDDMNRTTMAEQGGASGWIFARSHYQYDKAGRETATWRDEDTGSGSGWGERFEYENSDQVKKVFYNAQNAWTETPQNAANVQDYGYSADKLNRTSVSNNGVTTGFTMPNGMNQYTNVGKQAVGYDNHFNIASYNGNTFTYDAENHLVGGSMQATYDGLGRCVRRTTEGGTILFTYDGWRPILEWVDWGGWLAWNVYGAGPDEILARHDWVGGNWIYKQDKQGSVVAVLDGSGTVAEKYHYDAFGQPTVTDYWGNVRTDGNGRPVSWCGNRFMFTGREYIAELGIYDYRHRFYHPALGRFLQSDPMGFDAGDMNLFRYCGDDPVDRSDPTGLFDMWSNLTKFFNGNPSMDVVQAAWNERQQQTRIVLELVPAGDRHISTGDFKLKNGSQGVGLTEADFTVREPAKQEDGSSKVTGVYTLNVKYPDGPRSTAGPKTRQFGYSKEWEHAVPYDAWFGRALVTVREMNSKFHFRSPAEARDSLDRQLREGFNQAYRDSLNLHANGRHDSPFKYEE
jgi:RHS repeat-associated protein